MDRFEEYKFFAESTQHLSERRQATTQTYLTVNTAIFAILAFLVKDAGFRGWELAAVSLPVFAVGVLACWIWRSIISQNMSLIGWRYGQLQAMERAMPDSYQMYVKEYEGFYQTQPTTKRISFSGKEIWLPHLCLVLYAIYGVGLLGATLAGRL
jgi:hypothetical protein